MNVERWKQVDKLMELALEREPGQRPAFLKEACGGDAELRRELEALLAAPDEAGSFIESPALELAGPNLTSKARGATLVGQQIGGYRILSLLGAGGMGEVYRVRADRREIACSSGSEMRSQ